MIAEICILQGQIRITQMCYKTPSIQTSFKNQWLISSMKRKPYVLSLLKHVPVVCEDQPFQQITLLWQIIPWSFQEVTADWMHFSSNSYFNFIHDSLFPQKHMKGLILFLDLKVERANSQVKELDLRLHYWNFFLRLENQVSVEFCNLCVTVNLNLSGTVHLTTFPAKKIPLPN